MTKAKKQEMAPWQQGVVLAEPMFKKVMPVGVTMNYQKEAEFAIQVIEKSTALKNCNMQSIQNAVVNVASIGLSLNPATKHAYLVPRDGNAILDISYKGLVRLATDCGGIQWAKAMLVHECDKKFEMHGIDKIPTHDYNAFDTNRVLANVIGGYCVAKLSDGTYMIDTMPRSELDKVKDTSKAKNGPWKTWPTEMMKKSLIKRASKSWPETPQMERFHETVQFLNQHEGLADKAVNDAEEIAMPTVKSTGPTGETVQASSEGNTTVAEDESGKIDTSDAVDGELVDPGKAETDLDGPAWKDDAPTTEPAKAPAKQAGVDSTTYLTVGMKRIISAQLKHKGIDEGVCLRVFGYEDFDKVDRSQMNKILDWIKGQ